MNIYHARAGAILISALVFVVSTLVTLGWLMIPSSPQLIGKSVRRVKTHEKIVALTFDDGPNLPYTQHILDVLRKHDVKATFFIVGRRAQHYPDVIRQMYGQGHELGNHTWSHRGCVGRSCRSIRQEINRTDTLLRELGYPGPIYFRAPKGMKFWGLPKVLAERNRVHVLFDVIAWDWMRPGVKKIVGRVLDEADAGSIVLLHDGGGNRSQTVAATDIIIGKLKHDGYRFVTISELLACAG